MPDRKLGDLSRNCVTEIPSKQDSQYLRYHFQNTSDLGPTWNLRKRDMYVKTGPCQEKVGTKYVCH